MTLKLVEGDSNVIQMDMVSLNDIPELARRFADMIEGGEIDCPQSLLLIATDGNDVTISQWGECLNRAEGIGVLALASAQFMTDD